MSSAEREPDPLPILASDVNPARLAALDLARGFALFGVLFSNLHYFAIGPVLRGDFAYRGVDLWLYEGIGALFAGKFYPLLSFLFGFGVWLMYESARRRGTSFITYERRLVGLALLGVAHGVLLFDGDILFTYAMVGFVCLFFIPTAARTKFAVALGLVGVEFAVRLTNASLAIPVDPEWISGSSFSYAHAVVLRTIATVAQIPSLFYVGWLILAMFLVGAGVAQQGWLRSDHAVAFRRLRGPVLAVGVGLGWPAGALMHSDASGAVVQLATAFNVIAGPLVALGLFGWAEYLGRAPRRWSAGITAIGRTSLSCYLMQSFVMVIVLPAFGYDVRQQPLSLTMAIALVLYVTQFFGAQWWLKRFRFGPAEWFLRSFTYGQAQAMRR